MYFKVSHWLNNESLFLKRNPNRLYSYTIILFAYANLINPLANSFDNLFEILKLANAFFPGSNRTILLPKDIGFYLFDAIDLGSTKIFIDKKLISA